MVYIRFRGCGLYLYLDTDTNQPPNDYDPVTLNSFPKDPYAGDQDACHTASNKEYELRRSGVNPNSYFNIYPSPGDSAKVIYIQNKDRATACPDRSFLQWTEENCAVTKNTIKSIYNAGDLYSWTDPTMAKINLVGPLQASKWLLQFPTQDAYYGCGGSYSQNMRVAPY